jgi:hypothetical protein
MEKSIRHKRINAPIGSELSTHHTGLCPLLLVGVFMRLRWIPLRSGINQHSKLCDRYSFQRGLVSIGCNGDTGRMATGKRNPTQDMSPRYKGSVSNAPLSQCSAPAPTNMRLKRSGGIGRVCVIIYQIPHGGHNAI